MIAMISATAPDWMLTPADSARAVANVYTVSLLAIVPIVVAALAAILLRSAPAGTRSLIWRSAILALLVTFIVRLWSLDGLSWAIPSALAAPLVMLGRVQVTGPEVDAASSVSVASLPGSGAPVVQFLMFIYLAGIVVVLAPTLINWFVSTMRMARAEVMRDQDWMRQLQEAASSLGIRRHVTIKVSAAAVVPATWGWLRPVIVLPIAALHWSGTQRRAVLLHELSHIRAGDWQMGLATRTVCALYWFHPGAWWIARGVSREREYACDDTVLAAGIRASDYAELLALAAETLRRPQPATGVAMALTRGVGVRERLGAVLDTTRDLRAPSMPRQLVAVLSAFVIAIPAGAVRLSPTREVLTELMLDSRWESRAYAVIGLAQRVDSIGSARQAAAADPSPHVRAWAQYALARQNAPTAH
jgi:bla regulator protein BlaR1